MKTFYVYITANKSGTLYVGVTTNIKKRVSQHKHKLIPASPQSTT
jgi:putative endonuclease